MSLENFFTKFYLDKEKDIVVSLYVTGEDELTYEIRTPNHGTGNLIKNLSKVTRIPCQKDENEKYIIKDVIPACINDDGDEVYILRLGGIKIANIYPNGKIERKAKIPAIIKILLSQTKEYKIPIEKTIVKSYIDKKTKFRTDLHTHTTQILEPDVLIALGIKHQVRYPLYYIRKLGIVLSDKQEKEINKELKKVTKQYEKSELTGKALDRRIKDETFINFADLILNNLENAEENIIKIRNRMTLVKDGQAVFTNLEKVVRYRYIFQKGVAVEESKRIDLNENAIMQIEDEDIRLTLLKAVEDGKPGSKYENNTLTQDELLWMARSYQKQGIYYVESTITDLNKKIEVATAFLKEAHAIFPIIEAETGVKHRFLVGISRTLFTKEQLAKAPATVRTVSKSPYVVGMDLIGEEINDITEFEEIISDIVRYAVNEDEGYTIRLHAGETDSFRDNVEKALDLIKIATPNGKKSPVCRIGHGLYVPDLNSYVGKRIINKMKDLGAVVEFQFTSNVRLNNLINFEKHPIKEYLKQDVKCVQGTDGYGFYGIDAMDEQIAIRNLLELKEEDFQKMKNVEKEILAQREKYFEEQCKSFEEFLNGRTMEEAFLEEEEKNLKALDIKNVEYEKIIKIDSKEEFRDIRVKEMPQKFPIIIAGGSFNTSDRRTIVKKEKREQLKELLKSLDENKVFLIIGHTVQGYEKAVLDICQEIKKKFEIISIVPRYVSEEVKLNIEASKLDEIYVCPDPSELGIYKSFNYEIFERRNSIVIAFDGNSPVSNLIQEANNGKGKAKIYVNADVELLKEKAKTLEGYVKLFDSENRLVEEILEDNSEIKI